MAFDRRQFADLVETILTRANMHSLAAVDLLLGTAAQESAFGTYIRQTGGGPARGVFQMEPATERDIWANYLAYHPEFKLAVMLVAGIDGPDEWALETNLAYQTVMARIHYLRKPDPLPPAGDVPAMAKYWKRHYNTALGAGSVKEFAASYKRFVKLR